MRKNIVAFEVIYLNTLIEQYLNSSDKKILEEIFAFFNRNTIFNKKVFYKATELLKEAIDLNEYSFNILNNSKNSEVLKLELTKLKETLDIFIKKYSEPVEKKEICLKNLEQLSGYLSNHDNKLFDHLNLLTSFLYEYIEKNGINAANNNLYQYLSEILEMFEKSDQIIFNGEIIDEKFKLYFDILGLKPQNIVFLNKEENIKIMQDLLPDEVLNKCFFTLGLKEHLIMNNQFFILEMHERYHNDQRYSGLFSHELGHLLDVNIFEFNFKLLNAFYQINNNLNFEILQRWLNELIADNIAFSLEGNNYIEVLKEFTEGDDFIYPPNWLRLYMLDSNSPVQDFSSYSCDFQVVISGLLENKDFIANILSIVKKT